MSKSQFLRQYLPEIPQGISTSAQIQLDYLHIVLLCTIFIILILSKGLSRKPVPCELTHKPAIKGPIIAKSQPTASSSSSSDQAASKNTLSDTISASKISLSSNSNPHHGLFLPLKEKLLTYADLDKFPAGSSSTSQWISVLKQQHGDCVIEVHKKASTDFCFRIVADLEGTPEEAFDLLSNVEKRPLWDGLCEEAGYLHDLGGGCRIQYMYAKGFWPTSPRDTLVVGFMQRLEGNKGYMNVSTSLDNANGFLPRKNAVRMIAHLAGQVVTAIPDRARMCRVIQLIDGDLGGTLPKSLVSMITTQTIPLSLRRVNKILQKTPVHKTVSELITEAERGEVASENKSSRSHQEDIKKEAKITPVEAETPPSKSETKPTIKSFHVTTKSILEHAQPFIAIGIIIFILSRRRN